MAINPNQTRTQTQMNATQLRKLIETITKDMPFGVTINQDETGITVHFAIFDEGPAKLPPTTPKTIIL